ncbi:MAG: tyrosine--tRNA ligase, partial [Patescibacteria group bacterium]
MQNSLPDFLKRGLEQLIDEANFLTKLSGQRKLRIKLGIDPTSTDLHLGHMAVLKKLADFQFAGHQAVLIIGEFTAMIGDPTGRAGSREPLTKEQIKEHMKSYLKQAGKIINLSQAEVRYNSEW